MTGEFRKAKTAALNVWHRETLDPKATINDRAYRAMDVFEREAQSVMSKWRNRGFWDRVFNREPR